MTRRKKKKRHSPEEADHAREVIMAKLKVGKLPSTDSARSAPIPAASKPVQRSTTKAVASQRLPPRSMELQSKEKRELVLYAFRCDKHDLQALQDIASFDGLPVAYFIRKAIRRFLKDSPNGI